MNDATDSASPAVVLLTIVTESVLETRLTRDVASCGAHGWTITDARGHGPRNRRASELEGGNIRLETLVSPHVASAIMDVLAQGYFASYAVAAWTTPATVARPERYT